MFSGNDYYNNEDYQRNLAGDSETQRIADFPELPIYLHGLGYFETFADLPLPGGFGWTHQMELNDDWSLRIRPNSPRGVDELETETEPLRYSDLEAGRFGLEELDTNNIPDLEMGIIDLTTFGDEENEWQEWNQSFVPLVNSNEEIVPYNDTNIHFQGA